MNGKWLTLLLVAVLLISWIVIAYLWGRQSMLSERPAAAWAQSAIAQAEAGDTVYAAIMARKSVRTYQPGRSVSAELLQKLVKAGMAAPTGRNVIDRAFLIVTERARLDAMAAGLPYAKMLANAPAAIVVVGTPAKSPAGAPPDYWVANACASTENILIAAEGFGLGAVWTAAYPYPERIAVVRQTLNLPADVIPLCVIPVGYPGGSERPKDKWNPNLLFYNQWNGKN